MTVVILPVKYDVDKTLHCIERLLETKPRPRRLEVVCDDDVDIYKAVLNGGYPKWVRTYLTLRHLGIWGAANCGVSRITNNREPFVVIGNDVEFERDWLLQAEKCWRDTFPDNLGLLAFRDGIQDGHTAPHPMTTRAWCSVIYGTNGLFTNEFWHYHLDSELSVRSGDLGRYTYCEASSMPHRHIEDYKQIYFDTRPGRESDYEANNRRHREWVNGGLDAARLRMEALV